MTTHSRKCSITIFLPGNAGGTTVFYAWMAKYIYLNSDYDIYVVAGINDFAVSYLTDNEIKFKHLNYELGDNLIIPERTIFLINLLSGKLIGKSIFLNPDSVIHLFSTFTFDSYKYIPSFNLSYRWSYKSKKNIGKFLHPVYYKRVKRFLETAIQKNALAFMDGENYCANQIMFDLKLPPTYIPIFTDKYDRIKENIDSKPTYNIFWIGRLTDFKYMTVCGLIKLFDLININNFFEFHIIGNGREMEKVKAFATTFKNVNCIFYGYLKPEHLNTLLIEKSDIVIAHGTSILEAAKLRIPSLVVDGAYFIPEPPLINCLWLHECKDYYLGRIVNKGEKFTGHSLIEQLKNLNSKVLNEAAEKDYAHWQENHNINSTGEKLLKMIQGCSFTYRDFINTGITRFDFTGFIFQKAKDLLNK